jgi:uncharacterized protein YjbI with pentapeptide repeats
MESTNILNTQTQLNVKEAMLIESTITMAYIDGLTLNNVSAKNLKIFDANLSDLEINGAQMGGAYIHSIDMPPVGHPHYDAGAVHRPLKFEACNLNGSTMHNCNLSSVSISNCNLTGMTINGILVEELLKAYGAK